MKPISGSAYSFSVVIRRPQITPRCYGGQRLQGRNKSTSTNNDSSTSHSFSSNTHPDVQSGTANKSASPHASGSAPASAGASIASVPEATSLSLRRIIKESAIGRAASWYGRAQDRRPYWTQIWSTLLIYLCGDISAQLMLSNNDDSSVTEDGETNRSKLRNMWERYDPMRTLRHLTVGGVACIPVYKWCDISDTSYLRDRWSIQLPIQLD